MYRWLCYDEDTVFYVEAATKEEAQAFAALHDGHVVCPMQTVGNGKLDHADKGQQ